jgi:hypothetical protein
MNCESVGSGALVISRFAWAVKRRVAGSALQPVEDRLVHRSLHPSRDRAAKPYPAQLSLFVARSLSVSGRLTTECWRESALDLIAAYYASPDSKATPIQVRLSAHRPRFPRIAELPY